MGDYFTNAVRHPEDVGVGNIKRVVTADLSGLQSGNGLPIGTLEAGAVPLHCHVTIETLFNGTTPTLVVGTTADDDGYATTAATIPGTAGFKGNLTGALTGTPLASNTTVYVKVGGTSVTAGKANIVLYFVNKREVEGTSFPSN